MQQESPQPLQQPTSSSERARDLMTPGVVALPIATRLPVAARALAAHRVHAVLVLGFDGVPEGWLPAYGLVALSNTDRSLAWAMRVAGEPITAVSPFATRSEVVRELSQPGVNRLAVQERSDWMPEGVISDLDLTASATVDIN